LRSVSSHPFPKSKAQDAASTIGALTNPNISIVLRWPEMSGVIGNVLNQPFQEVILAMDAAEPVGHDLLKLFNVVRSNDRNTSFVEPILREFQESLFICHFESHFASRQP
jgi:hypothetical protein